LRVVVLRLFDRDGEDGGTREEMDRLGLDVGRLREDDVGRFRLDDIGRLEPELRRELLDLLPPDR
jgi:hypothetical protein